MRLRRAKNAVGSFCLVTVSFLLLWFCLMASRTLFERNARKGSGSESNADDANAGKSGPEGIRRWKTVGPDSTHARVTLATSPYHALNKRRRLTWKYDPDVKPMVILWMASRTLKVTRETSGVFRKCPVNNCVVSPTQSIAEQASAVVYDDDQMAEYVEPLPTGQDNRILVYYSMKTPSDVPEPEPGFSARNFSWASAINWVWSYRLDSDIFEPFAYIKPAHDSVSDDINKIMRKKTKLALWITPRVKPRHEENDVDKNAHEGASPAGVEAYLRGMKSTLSYDTMTVAELKEALSEKRFSLSQYFFVFAFEWASCPDYLTDLYFYTLDPRVHAVPVVRGGFAYARHLPAHSFVNADDFQGPEDLALYLRKLAVPTEAYINLLKKKLKYQREEGVRHAWCQLCDRLHHAREDPRLKYRIDDIHAWFREGSQCKITNRTGRIRQGKRIE